MATVTKCNELQHRKLTPKQLRAVDLLTAGRRDADVADELDVHRVTITRWRLYSPQFQAALEDRRRELWAGSFDRLAAIFPKAMHEIDKSLTDGNEQARLAAAFRLLIVASPLLRIILNSVFMSPRKPNDSLANVDVVDLLNNSAVQKLTGMK